MNVAFLGLGIMGSRMAANLLRAGHTVSVWTRTPGKADAWVAEHGGRAAAGPREAAAGAEAVITMVVDGDQVLGLAAELAADEGAGRLLIDMSTIGPQAARDAAGTLASNGWSFMDAPVTGSSPKAEDGTLTIMTGASEADHERALPLLEAMGTMIVHAGEVGQGQMIKLINNSVAAANTLAVAEALLVGRATGVDLDALVDVMQAGSGASAVLALKARPMREHDYSTLFKLAHMLKDVRLCLDESMRAGIVFPSAAAASEALSAAMSDGHGDDDFAAMLEPLERQSGFTL
jgi:3-hydroxyisobutyrate dehydrogenase-like beta-hydroxyacid dehydrogenase